MSNVVTRFAPSPTGHLHIGGARTAIFSWLMARNAGGRFILRIEDTDRTRSKDEYTEAILASMKWLGLDWDDEPLYQSHREDVYNKYIDQLIDEGKAYYCECSPEKVEQMREEARAKGLKPKYNGCCRDRNLGPGENRVVRFRGPQDGRTVFKDIVKGSIAVDHAELDDMILRRTDGSPTYNLAVVVDDHEMGVTCVLRGDDHVNNTPRQILLYEALGWDVPEFGHVPMILGKDKKKLSKRHGAQSVMEYEQMGYLPEAVLNYLVRLGWSLGDEEIFTRDELVNKFPEGSFSKSPAAFDPDKLQWLNAHYIKEGDPRRLAELMLPLLAEKGLDDVDTDFLASVVPFFQTRAKMLGDLVEGSLFLLVQDDRLEYDEKAVAKCFTDEGRTHLKAVRERLAALEDFTAETTEAAVKGYIEENELKFKILGQPLRVALSGKTAGPGLGDTFVALGRERALNRIDLALANL